MVTVLDWIKEQFSELQDFPIRVESRERERKSGGMSIYEMANNTLWLFPNELAPYFVRYCVGHHQPSFISSTQIDFVKLYTNQTNHKTNGRI